MKFRIRFAEQIVGLFVLLAILGLAGILILLGANQRWFARNYYFTSQFKSAAGLSAGMPIELRGFEIGKVDSIALNDENLVDIEFYIYDTYYDKVVPNSVLELASSPLGFGGGLRFHPGRNSGPALEEFSFIPSLDSSEGKSMVEHGLVELPQGEDMIGSVLGQLGPILTEVSATLASVHSLTDSITLALAGEGGGPMAGILNNLTASSRRVNELLKTLDRVSTGLQEITSNVQATTEALKDPTGLVPKLLDPQGSLATLLDDDNRLFDQITTAMDELNAIIGQLGKFSAYVNSTQPQITGLLEKGHMALDQGSDVLEAVKNNPLLRGGVPEKKEQDTTLQGFRDKDF